MSTRSPVRGTPARFFRDLPLLWKLLLPFLTLLVIVGAAGAFVIVRDLSSRAQAVLNEDLLQASLRARALLNNRELYVLESANLAANLEGIADAVTSDDRQTARRLLRSALALKIDLNLLVVTDDEGIGFVEFARLVPQTGLAGPSGTDWSTEAFVGEALIDTEGGKSAGFVQVGSETMLAIASPICSGTETCDAVGAAIAGIAASRLAIDTSSQSGTEQSVAGIAIFGPDGTIVARAGLSPSKGAEPPATGDLVRRNERIGESEIATLYAPLEIQGARQGTVAVTLPTEPVFASVRGAGLRLAAVLIGALLGIVAVGALISRLILNQVRPLVTTNRALGKGDLAARAPVLGNDELGELARGVNQMAEQLKASRDTLEMRVAQRTEEVERLLRERTEFFAALSHELRTPLAVIRNEAKMMLDPTYTKNGKTRPGVAKKIQRASDELLAYVDEILELARVESGRIEVDLQNVTLAKAIEDLRATSSGLAKAGDIKLSVKVPAGVPTVRADPRRLREVLLNLVDNAVKYTPAGGRVEISAVSRNGRVEVSVTDTGVGIPKEVSTRIFDPFYRVPGVKPQRGEPTTGIGLALTKRLVEAQGGHIGFVSKPGEGSTFTFTLRQVKGKRAEPSRKPRKKASPKR
ncbi:MAG: HAMP domain-containing sensor histidine kinase [Actinomycetota bacterium]